MIKWYSQAKEIVDAGGVLLCPTDTVWGLSGNALEETVAQKIYEIKQRPKNKTFLLLMHSFEQLAQYVDDDLSMAKEFLQHTNRPTTIIYHQPKHIPKSLLAADGSIGIRIPKVKWMEQFLRFIDTPLISTSANQSGEPTPKTYEEISPIIVSSVDYVVPYIPDHKEKFSSQIITFKNGEVTWIRK